MDPARVLWIGGGQGSGKSSIAWTLSRRHGLQLYNIDHRTQAHVPRHRPHPFFELSEDERWVHPDVETMLRWFVETSADRLRIVLEDLAELPDEPGAIVEGPQLFPAFVEPLLAAREQAVFLVPRPEEQRVRLLARGPITRTSQPELARAKATERDLLISRRIAEEARERGLCTLTVDRPLAGMIDLVEERLRPALDRLPRGGDLAAARRRENEAIAEQVRLWRATGLPARPYPPLVFGCECGAPGCDATIERSLEDYERSSVNAVTHTQIMNPSHEAL
jgi:hypothetical protein